MERITRSSFSACLSKRRIRRSRQSKGKSHTAEEKFRRNHSSIMLPILKASRGSGAEQDRAGEKKRNVAHFAIKIAHTSRSPFTQDLVRSLHHDLVVAFHRLFMKWRHNEFALLFVLRALHARETETQRFAERSYPVRARSVPSCETVPDRRAPAGCIRDRQSKRSAGRFSS